jgi:secreted PhoX family phosphatase
MDAEVCGPCFTPDGQTLFVAVQHPAEGSETLEKASTRWPDFDPKIPPRPSIVVITRDGGGEIGV